VPGKKGDQKYKAGNQKEQAAQKTDNVPTADTGDSVKNCRGNKKEPSPDLAPSFKRFF